MIRRIAFLSVAATGLLACGWLALTPAPTIAASTRALATPSPTMADASGAVGAELGLLSQAEEQSLSEARREQLVLALRTGLTGGPACESEAEALNRVQAATSGWSLADTSAALQRVASDQLCDHVRVAIRWAQLAVADSAHLTPVAGAAATSAVYGKGEALGGEGGPGYRYGD